MKIYPSGYKEALMAGSQTAFLYSFLLSNGTNRYFTDADIDISVDGITYYCGARIQRSALSLTIGLDTSNLDITILYNAGFVTKQDIKAGLYQGATFSISQVIVDNPSLGMMQFLSGLVGEANLKRIKVVHTLHSLSDLLNAKASRVTSPTCTWKLGDQTLGKCRKDISSFINSTTIYSVEGLSTFEVNTSSFSPSSHVFNFGYVLFTSGLNSGFSAAIQLISPASGISGIQLWSNIPYEISIGDSIDIYPGCDKSFNTCNTDFGNAINFGGQPYVPGEIKAQNGVQ